MTILAISFFALIGLLWWVYKLGRKSSQLEAVEDSIEKVGNVNEFNRKEDIEAERQVRNAGDNPVSGSWLRKE
jgi:hypothetical protein